MLMQMKVRVPAVVEENFSNFNLVRGYVASGPILQMILITLLASTDRGPVLQTTAIG